MRLVRAKITQMVKPSSTAIMVALVDRFMCEGNWRPLRREGRKAGTAGIGLGRVRSCLVQLPALESGM